MKRLENGEGSQSWLGGSESNQPGAASSEVSQFWPLIEGLLRNVERPSRYINHEYQVCHKFEADTGYRLALAYPDTYEIGQSNQAIALLYEIANGLDGVAAERVFLPWVDMIAAMREINLPLTSLESSTPLFDFDLLGITIPHELAATNILEILNLAGLPLRAVDRDVTHPLVLGGG
ncbi:MAG: hypothetical protein LBH87_00360, partial [Coriobacteriales bacterium]|nr:hypothetical protein [Coriobacteriales bacterium]